MTTGEACTGKTGFKYFTGMNDNKYQYIKLLIPLSTLTQVCSNASISNFFFKPVHATDADYRIQHMYFQARDWGWGEHAQMD